MHEIAITWPQFDETEMYKVHTHRTRSHAQHIIAWHFDGTYEYGSDDTTK